MILTIIKSRQTAMRFQITEYITSFSAVLLQRNHEALLNG